MKGSRGAVLILVLWVLLGMSLLALSFAATIRTEVDAARNVVEQKQSYYLARAGIEYAIYRLMESQSAFSRARQNRELDPESIPQVLRGQVTLQMPNGTARVRIIDETGKININLAREDLIFNLLVMVGLSAEDASLITDSILDWRDRDDLEHANGAETRFYQGLEEPYRAKNGLLDAPEELLLVRGVTPEIYYGTKTKSPTGEEVELYGLQNYFTTFTSLNRINVNSAPVAVLAAIPDLSVDMARSIHDQVSQSPARTVAEIMERIPGLPTNVASLLSTVRSNTYTLLSEARLTEAEAINRIRCVVRLGRGSQRGYAILYWNEANIEL